MKNPYRIAALGIVVAGVVFGVVILGLPGDRQTDLVVDLARAAIGAIPVIFVTVIVADLVSRRDAANAAAAQRDRELAAFRTRTIDAYNQSKATRRTLRAQGLRPDTDAPLTTDALAILDAAMQDLSRTQLAFEQLKREAGSTTGLLRNPGAIEGHLETIEKSLNRVLKEWEANRSRLTPADTTAVFEAWPHYADFVAAKDAARLADNPKAAFDALEAAVLTEAGRPIG